MSAGCQLRFHNTYTSFRCYFDCPILSQDIVLADLPGTSDVNKDRVKATKHYMSDVHYTGVVTKISRAQSDKATNLSLVGSYKRKRGPNLFLVATHADVSELEL